MAGSRQPSNAPRLGLRMALGAIVECGIMLELPKELMEKV
jgi:hypothetical protein